MIIGNIHYKAPCTELSEKVKECLQYAHTHNLSQYPTGKHEVRGEELYINIVSYETTTAENRFWEAHKAYLDLHLLLQGCERIDLNLIDNMELKPYAEQEDFLPAVGSKKVSVLLEVGDYLVCYPEDVHMTALHDGTPATIKKAIFKIKI